MRSLFFILTSFASQISQAQREKHTHTLAFHQIGLVSVVCILNCHSTTMTTTNNILHFFSSTSMVVYMTRTIPVQCIVFNCMRRVNAKNTHTFYFATIILSVDRILLHANFTILFLCVGVCMFVRWFGKVGTFISPEKKLIAFAVRVCVHCECVERHGAVGIENIIIIIDFLRLTHNICSSFFLQIHCSVRCVFVRCTK